MLAASVRGKSHAHNGTFRDDSYKFDRCAPWTCVAVSDGAGSSSLSRVASRIACDTAIAHMRQLLADYKLTAPPGDTDKLTSDLHRLKSFLTESAVMARRAVLREVQQRKVEHRDMYATLLVMAHARWGDEDVVGSIQIGDGTIGVCYREEEGSPACTVLGDADHGEFSSETRFLTSPNLESEFSSRVRFTHKSRVECIGVMSDGVSDDFFPEEKRLVQLFHGDPIEVEGLTSKQGDPVRGVMHDVRTSAAPGEALCDWLQYEKRGSFDDRTLVLFYRSPLP